MDKRQLAVALALLKARPPVVPGTRAILDDAARKTWFNCVTEVARTQNLNTHDLPAFFDAAGVPD